MVVNPSWIGEGIVPLVVHVTNIVETGELKLEVLSARVCLGKLETKLGVTKGHCTTNEPVSLVTAKCSVVAKAVSPVEKKTECVHFEERYITSVDISVAYTHGQHKWLEYLQVIPCAEGVPVKVII